MDKDAKERHTSPVVPIISGFEAAWRKERVDRSSAFR